MLHSMTIRFMHVDQLETLYHVMESNVNLGSFGINGVKRSFSLKCYNSCMLHSLTIKMTKSKSSVNMVTLDRHAKLSTVTSSSDLQLRGQRSKKGNVRLHSHLFTDLVIIIFVFWNLVHGPLSNSKWHVPLHRHIQGGAKGARTSCGSEAKTVKSACFWPILISFHHSAPHSIPLAWNPAYASALPNQT